LLLIHKEWWKSSPHDHCHVSWTNLVGKIRVVDEEVSNDMGVRDKCVITQVAGDRSLPEMSAEHFVKAFCAMSVEKLKTVAALINQAPTGLIIQASEERVRKLFAELTWDALQLGLRLRMEALISQSQRNT
jgi:hypothetical protein